MRLEISAVLDTILEAVANDEISAWSGDAEAVDSGSAVVSTADVLPCRRVGLDTAVEATVDVPRSAAEAAVSTTVLVVGGAVLIDSVLVSRVELSGTAEVVAEVGLVPGAAVEVWVRTMVLGVVASVAEVVTC